jgi:hypothetical protein
VLGPGTRLEGGLLCILEPIDAGGMGEVYLAWHEVLNAEVAVKVSQAPELEARFRHEIELQNDLGGHPHIVAVKTAGRFGDGSYLVMEYVPGVDLGRSVAGRGPLPWREACECIRQAALGLAHAHAMGVVHRDLKPSNLVRSEADGSVKILDWGLARRLDRASAGEDRRLTRPGVIPGTPDYIAPERIGDPEKVSPASDLYSLGCTLYELLTGHPPFHEHPDKLMAHLQAPIPAVPVGRAVPPEIERVLRRLLAKRPRDRYGSAREFVEALDVAAPGRPGARGRRPYQALLAALFLLSFGLAWGLRGYPPTETPVVKRNGQPALQVHVWRPETQFRPLLQALPVRSGDEVQIRCRVPEGQHVAMYLVNSSGKLRLLERYPASNSGREVIYPGEGKTCVLQGQPGTEMILALGRTAGPISEETGQLWDGEGEEGSWPKLPQSTVVRLGMDGVDIEGERNRDLGEIRDRSDPEERIKRRLDKLRERLKPTCTFFEGLAFAHH